MIEWYDGQFGANGALIGQYNTLADSVRVDRQRSQRDSRHRPANTVVAGGSVPVDHDEADECALVGETVPDGCLVQPGTVVHKTWTLRNTGQVFWHERWLSRQGTPGIPGWLHCVGRTRIPDTAPGESVIIAVDLATPNYTGACIAYFKMTDSAGRPYFPSPAIRPLHCSLYVSEY